MAARKKTVPGPKKLPQPVSETGARPAARVSRGRTHPRGASFPVAPPRSELPRSYAKTLGEIKQRIQQERLRVVLAANAAMVLLYWDIGRMILDRQKREGWGAKIIDRLAADLREAFPDMKGFSLRNLKYMRAFAAEWTDLAIVQQVAAQIPWFHNCLLLDRVPDPTARNWYIRQVMKHGWSRNILTLQIDTRDHQRHGKAITNFKATLPPADSDLAAQVFKDPYLFDFLGTADPRREREVEQALVDHIQRFLLELGSGFAFVGRQVHLEFASHDYYLDLLFYHLKLRCYVVIELKAVSFEPGFAGQMNMYLSAVDDLLRHADDKPTIGLLLVREKNRVLVEMLAPYKGRVYDPCCGSGGMFVSSEKFIEAHSCKLGDISIYGQESNATTRRLAVMNLALRGIEADFGPEHTDTFRRDLHPDLRAGFVLAVSASLNHSFCISGL